ncbi:MAG: sugar transferase [Ktedonobacterales bacterium]
MKRLIDITVAAIALALLSPLLGMIAVVIRLTDGKPLLYRGVRIGLHEQTFFILKFRTMRTQSQSAGEITVSEDPRVTRIGRVLRTTKLDELPQLINVLRGDMSIVGPRPESPYFVRYYTPGQRIVLTVRPGITGPSQILYRNEERLLTDPNPEEYYRAAIMPAKLAIDLDYVHHHSLGMDLRIIARTLGALVRPTSSDLARAEAPLQYSGIADEQGRRYD